MQVNERCFDSRSCSRNKHSSYYLVDNGTMSCFNILHNLEDASKIRNRESKIMNVHFDRFVLSLKNKFEALRMSVFCEDSDPARGQAWGGGSGICSRSSSAAVEKPLPGWITLSSL